MMNEADAKYWADISVIVQGALLPLSIFILIWQISKQAKLTRASNAQSLVEMSSPFNLALVQDEEMAKLWKSGASEYEKLDPITQERYVNMLIWWLLLHENIHHQHQERLIDRAVYNSWERDLNYFVKKHRIEDRWPELRDSYHPSFVKHLDQIIMQQHKSGNVA